jgi:phosphosulfolactate synthase (CoM biosynthesis protein A)
MQNYYASNYSDAIKYAWETQNQFRQTETIQLNKKVECIKVYCFGIHYMTIYWDKYLFENAPKF